MKKLTIACLVAAVSSCNIHPDPAWPPSPPVERQEWSRPEAEGHHGHNAFSTVYR